MSENEAFWAAVLQNCRTKFDPRHFGFLSSTQSVCSTKYNWQKCNSFCKYVKNSICLHWKWQDKKRIGIVTCGLSLLVFFVLWGRRGFFSLASDTRDQPIWTAYHYCFLKKKQIFPRSEILVIANGSKEINIFVIRWKRPLRPTTLYMKVFKFSLDILMVSDMNKN